MKQLPELIILGSRPGTYRFARYGHETDRMFVLQDQDGKVFLTDFKIREIRHHVWDATYEGQTTVVNGSQREAMHSAIGYLNYIRLFFAIREEEDLTWHRTEGESPRQKWQLFYRGEELAQLPVTVTEHLKDPRTQELHYAWHLSGDLIGTIADGLCDTQFEAMYEGLNRRWHEQQSRAERLSNQGHEDLALTIAEASNLPPDDVDKGEEQVPLADTQVVEGVVQMRGFRWFKRADDRSSTYTLLNPDGSVATRYGIVVNRPHAGNMCSYTISAGDTRHSGEQYETFLKTMNTALAMRAQLLEVLVATNETQYTIAIKEPKMDFEDVQRYLDGIKKGSVLRSSVPVYNGDEAMDALLIALYQGHEIVTNSMSTPTVDKWSRNVKPFFKPLYQFSENGYSYSVEVSGVGFKIQRRKADVIETVEGSSATGGHTCMTNIISEKPETLCFVTEATPKRYVLFDSSREAITLLEAFTNGTLPSFGRLMKLEFLKEHDED